MMKEGTGYVHTCPSTYRQGYVLLFSSCRIFTVNTQHLEGNPLFGAVFCQIPDMM